MLTSVTLLALSLGGVALASLAIQQLKTNKGVDEWMKEKERYNKTMTEAMVVLQKDQLTLSKMFNELVEATGAKIKEQSHD